MRKRTKIILYTFVALIVLLAIFLFRVSNYKPTLPNNVTLTLLERDSVDSHFYTLQDSWLLQNQDSLWEMYVQGSPVERGNKIGALSKDLVNHQEDVFVAQIKQLIPSKFLLKFLRVFVGIFNRNLGEYIPEENKEEIYAISRYANGDYGWIGNPYQRMMNYHAAHDIGHAVQVMGFVGCSSLSACNSKTADSSLIIGRNFDFYVGDEFAKNKIVLFIKPDKGYPHAIISWGGMIGAVSGMNNQGLTVTVNAAPTEMPFNSATPVSILAREILQYAKNIDEAVAIAKKRETFVSEQFIIGSAIDNRSISIEKTKKACVVYDPQKDYLICTNHFQSEQLLNKSAVSDSVSKYRHDRMQEWVDSLKWFDPQTMVTFLRDTKGKKNEDIGLGKEKSINQLIAHHSIVFHPKSKTFWISTAPLQEGKFLAYNLDSVFNKTSFPTKSGVSIESMGIAADSNFIKNELQLFYKNRREHKS